MLHYLPIPDITTEVPPPDEWAIPLQESLSLETNSSFIPGTNLQFAWDSVSTNAFLKCPRYYKWTIIEGWRLDPQPSTLTWGIAFHKVIEVWDKMVALGHEKEDVLYRCVRLAGLMGEYIVPNRTERTKETLVRAVVWYIDTHWEDNAETLILHNGKPAVEFSFALPMMDFNGVEILLTGHIDKVVKFMGEVWPLDHKSTQQALDDRFASKFKLEPQMKGYMAVAYILAETTAAFPTPPAGFIIDAVQLGVNFNRFLRVPLHFYKEEIEEYLRGFPFRIREAAMYAEANYWPARETSCELYGGCVFKEICSQVPGKWQRMLEGNFIQGTWDPLKSR